MKPLNRIQHALCSPAVLSLAFLAFHAGALVETASAQTHLSRGRTSQSGREQSRFFTIELNACDDGNGGYTLTATAPGRLFLLSLVGRARHDLRRDDRLDHHQHRHLRPPRTGRARALPDPLPRVPPPPSTGAVPKACSCLPSRSSGTSTRSWGTGRTCTSTPPSTADVDGNGGTDLVYVWRNPTDDTLRLRTKFSDWDGSNLSWQHFEEAHFDSDEVHEYPTLTGDVNDDGRTDLFFIWQRDAGGGLTITTKVSNGDGTWQTSTRSLGDGVKVHEYPTLAGDVNGDGSTDLVFIFRDPGTGGLRIRTKFSQWTGSAVNWIATEAALPDGPFIHDYPTHLGNVNGDGRADLIFVWQSASDGLMLRSRTSNGDGTWGVVTQTMGDGIRMHDYPALSGDFNGDGFTDMAFIGRINVFAFSFFPRLFLRVKFSDQAGGWTHGYTNTSDALFDDLGIHEYPALGGDVDGDGRDDVIFQKRYEASCAHLHLRVKEAAGTGSWSARAQLGNDGPLIHQFPTKVGDVNLDGKADLIYTWDPGGTGLRIRTKVAN